MRVIFSVLALGVLAACTPAIPDSGAGSGFDSFGSNEPSTPEAGETINGDLLVPPAVVSSEVPIAPPPQSSTTALAPVATVASSIPASDQPAPAVIPLSGTDNADDIARETAAALQAANANSGVAPLQASPSNPAPQIVSNAGISDENDFAAVSSRQTIQSDADRIAQNRSQYTIVQPTALPSRTNTGQPNIVKYALATSNPKGTRVYTRAGINMAARNHRNCAGYASPDQAQMDFLAKGGPQRDRMALDPDGDGYACSWDPAPFRTVATN
ncbi:hypothetical protein QEZ52_06825 [Aliisedimentitalea scapharcae]|uniref:Excalibur calcium-binding domain-containing protein n=1 Tax=Aliisedimentitalea scapharcae TaxID=1524259 RepID=A0ABZ2XWA5_9RHOB|nr:hypothetical protein K3727_06740 [Rhodobacteraceae bacterium M382]